MMSFKICKTTFSTFVFYGRKKRDCCLQRKHFENAIMSQFLKHTYEFIPMTGNTRF